MQPSGIRPNLNSGDKKVKQQLDKCLLWVYSELIRSNIPGSSGVNPSRPPNLRPSLPSDMKPSREGPSSVKPTREELQARVESLAKKKRSFKNKAQAPLPILGEPGIKAPTAANSPTSVLFDLHGLEVRVTEAAQSPASDI